MANKYLALGIMDCLIEKSEKGENIQRDYYVESTKYLNSIGSTILLDTLSRAEVKDMLNKYLNRVLK